MTDPHAFDAGRAVAEVDALLAGPVPEAEACAIAGVWEGPDLLGVYEEAWTAAEETADGHLTALKDDLKARWGLPRTVGMRVPIFRRANGAPMPPLFRTLVKHDLLGDLAVWGPVGDHGRYVAVSLNQIDGDRPFNVAAIVSEDPIVELEDE